MGLETGTYISDLVSANPPGSDQRKQGDDHLRLIKSVLQNTFPSTAKAFRFPRATAKTAVFSAATTDQNVLFTCDSAGGAYNATLPTLVAGDAGWSCIFVKTTADVNVVTILPAAGTINGLASVALGYAFEMAILYWTGTTWICDNQADLVNIAYTNVANVFTADQTIRSTDAGATVGPNIILDRNSASPAAADVIGSVVFAGRDSGAAVQNYADILTTIDDPVAATEDATISVRAVVAGTMTSHLTAGAGVVTITGGQIAFPATQVPSAGVNTLDDYEEGTFTPTISFGGASVGVVYNGAQTYGKYTKIGDKVFATGRLNLTSKGSSTGNVLINAFPFSCPSYPGIGNCVLNAGGSTASGIKLYMTTGAATASLYIDSAAADTIATNANVTNTFDIFFSVTYCV
jgi:hypothetical protein